MKPQGKNFTTESTKVFSVFSKRDSSFPSRISRDKYTACHAESFACCHSEGAEATEESQDRLREASLVFDTNERT